MFTVSRLIDSMDCCPWGAVAGRHVAAPQPLWQQKGQPLYTTDERRRRDATPWTMVQGVLAPVQFLVFAVSVCLVIRYLATGDGWAVATASIVVKTALLYTIMVTGAIWEKKVFGRYLFAPAFFWEDAVSMIVIALHTIYLFALFSGWMDPRSQMLVALAGYAFYVANATQFVMKLRAARKEQEMWSNRSAGTHTAVGATS